MYGMEIANIGNGHPPSQGAYYACIDVAQNTAPLRTPNLVFIESEGTPVRRMYTDYPEWEEWSRLEQGGVVQGDNGVICIIIDGMH